MSGNIEKEISSEIVNIREQFQSVFPLYDTLILQIKNEDKDITMEQKHEFIKYFKNLDRKGFDMFYILIRVYYLKNEKIENTNDLFKIPYQGKELNKRTMGTSMVSDAQFNLENLPYRLKRILFNFLERDNQLKKNNK